MLEVPEEPSGAKKHAEVPCFRCLFEKPISDKWCQPETCDMLSHWLMDDGFEWKNYVFGWLVEIELKNVKENELPLEF